MCAATCGNCAAPRPARPRFWGGRHQPQERGSSWNPSSVPKTRGPPFNLRSLEPCWRQAACSARNCSRGNSAHPVNDSRASPGAAGVSARPRSAPGGKGEESGRCTVPCYKMTRDLQQHAKRAFFFFFNMYVYACVSPLLLPPPASLGRPTLESSQNRKKKKKTRTKHSK